MKAKHITTAVLAGAAAGAIAGLLLAPRSGKETRTEFKRKGSQLADGLKIRYNDVLASLVNNATEAKESVDGWANELKQKAKSRARKVDHATENALDKVEDFANNHKI